MQMEVKHLDLDVDILINHQSHEPTNDNLRTFAKIQGEKYAEYRNMWFENPLKNIVNDVPIHLDIEATSACNMRCTMCPRTDMLLDGTFWKIQNFNFDLYKKIIDESTINKNLKSIKFQYLGEPLINKKLSKMIKYAKDKQVIDVQFNTNASLLTEKKSIEIINSGVDKIYFSFDSPYREKYNSIRIDGDYDKVLNNIKNFMKIRNGMNLKKPLTKVQMVLMKETQDEWYDFKKLFEPIVDTVGYGMYLDHGTHNKADKELFKKKKNQKPFCCPSLWQRMFIHPDGIVTPCCLDAKRNLVMGNINENSISEIWNNEKYQKMRDLHRKGEYKKINECKNCSLANYRKEDHE
mgnify:CR=1 FL=1